MKENLFATPETGLLLEQAGLISIHDCLFVWEHKYISSDWKINAYSDFYIDAGENVVAAPTLGELVKKYKELFLIEELYKVGNCLLEDNEAECLAQRLLQLYIDGKLKKRDKPIN